MKSIEQLRIIGKIKIRNLIRKIVSLTFGETERTVEYRFVHTQVSRIKDAKFILDVGSSRSSLAYDLAKEGRHVIAVDVEDFPFRHKNLMVVKADARSLPFRTQLFDVITSVSTIEHIGQGEYGDGIDENGDFFAMMEMARVCQSKGFLFLTTSWSTTYRGDKGYERHYDDKRLEKLTSNLKVDKNYYAPLRKIGKYSLKWSNVPKENTQIAFDFGSRPLVMLSCVKE